jgi:hypothetical protein
MTCAGPGVSHKGDVRLHRAIYAEEVREGLEEDIAGAFTVRDIEQKLLEVLTLDFGGGDEKDEEAPKAEMSFVPFGLRERQVVSQFGFDVWTLGILERTVRLAVAVSLKKERVCPFRPRHLERMAVRVEGMILSTPVRN